MTHCTGAGDGVPPAGGHPESPVPPGDQYREPVAGPSPLLSLPGMADELRRVDEALREWLANEHPAVTELALHVVGGGGKRLRPALAVASAATCGGIPVGQEVILGGAAVELIHVGSLYHDDVIDDARLRRGLETANARFGNRQAILGGDYLLAKASEIAASLGTEVAGLLAATIAHMCEGQVQELVTAFDVERSESSYRASVEGKTASVYAAACRVGAVTGGLEPAAVEAVTRYGRAYGMAFQVVDDVLDVVSNEEALGKPAGQDLGEGVYTLPTLRALAAGDDELRSLLGRTLEGDEVERARKLVRRSGGVEEAMAAAGAYAEEAVAALADLPDTAARRALVDAARALLASVPAEA